MKIKIEQTLHGYLDGHQLLNSSTELGVDEKRILLYQTDLSGSSIEDDFKTYITGYPITKKNLYAFSYSWYADEMKRPGCVWTQTLLINFSDLGKIPEFNILLGLFKRPKVGEYTEYGKSIVLDENLLISTFYTKYESFDLNKNNLLIALYEYPGKTVVVPSYSSKEYENTILSLWSDPCTRPRRRVSFSSGALSIRSVDKKLFDLQIAPYSKMNSIQRQADDLLIIKGNAVEGEFDWNILTKYPKIKIRQFLWTYGSDILGERRNLIPLLEIFNLLNDPNISITTLSQAISKYFPLRTEAKHLKSRLYGDESILPGHLDEKEIIHYLVTSEDLDFIASEGINIDARLTDLIKSNKISLTEFIQVWNSARPERINTNIWKNLDITTNEILNLLKSNENLTDVLLENYPKIIFDEKIWEADYGIQKKILSKIQTSNENIKPDIVFAALEAKSPIIFDMYNYVDKKTIVYSLDWLNNPKNKNNFANDWANFITKKEKYTFKDWVYTNRDRLDVKTYQLIFLNLHYDDIKQFDFDSSVWVKGYRLLQEQPSNLNVVYVAAVLLSLALNNKLVNSENIIVETFHDFYSYAASSKIESSVWNIIPNDEDDSDDGDDSLGFFARLFGFNSGKKKQVESWDYCERLVRILVSKYVKYGWPTQSFLNTLKNKGAFERTLKYCLNSKKGLRYLERLLVDFKNGESKPLQFQINVVKSLLNQEDF